MEGTVKERIIKIADIKKLSINQFEQRCGLSNGLIRKVNKPTIETILKIQKTFPDINPLWLATGEGEMLAQPLAQPAEAKGIPYFDDAKFGCSPSGFIGALEKVKADSYMLVPGLPNDGQTFVVRARGESMVNKSNPEQSIPNGAYVAIQKSNLSTPQWGEAYALSTDDGCIIKRLYPSDKDGCVKCVSFNEEYPCFDLPCVEIHDIGLVKAVLTVSIWK